MITAMIQARMSSTRLPGKVLMPILGEPMLLRQIQRIQHCKMISNIVVITSENSDDDPISYLCLENNIDCYRGSLEDVLDRYYQASLIYPSEHVVRLTADCPLVDWFVIGQVVQLHLDNKNEYSANILERSFPDGLDVEVFQSKLLKHAWKNAKGLSHREHVTTYIRQNSESIRTGNLQCSSDLSGMRWTVDHMEDLLFVRNIYGYLYKNKSDFNMVDILNLLKNNPELLKSNQHLVST